MTIKIFSPNMLKIFDECQQKFFFKYVEKLLLPQRSSIFEKGKKIHALANYYLNCFDIAKIEKTLSSDEKIAWESLKNNKYFKLNVINTEYNLSCKIGKYWAGGRLDAFMYDNQSLPRHAGFSCRRQRSHTDQDRECKFCLRNNDKGNRQGTRRVTLSAQERVRAEQNHMISASSPLTTPERFRNELGMTQNANTFDSFLSPFSSSLDYVILDYKTGNIPQNAEKDFQTIVYLLCGDKWLQQKGGYKSLKFVYLGLKNNTEKEILLTENLKKEYEEKIIQTCDKIDFAINSKVYSKSNIQCEKCEYNKICN